MQRFCPGCDHVDFYVGGPGVLPTPYLHAPEFSMGGYRDEAGSGQTTDNGIRDFLSEMSKQLKDSERRETARAFMDMVAAQGELLQTVAAIVEADLSEAVSEDL